MDSYQSSNISTFFQLESFAGANFEKLKNTIEKHNAVLLLNTSNS
jgi:hypothetical protein